MDKTDPREKSDRYRKHMTVKFLVNKQFEFVPTQFLIDENYVGNPPRVQISFENLNDNIDENFLRRELEKLGKLRSVEIVRHPETRRHLGLARVQFEDSRIATTCVETYNRKQIMGKQLSVYHDVRFTTIERRKEEKMRPQPIINHMEPKVQVLPKPPLPPSPFTSLPFPPIPTVDPISRTNKHVSLDERLKMMFNQSSKTPPEPTPLDKGIHNPPFQNHISRKPLEKSEFFPPAKTKEEEEEDRLWNPVTTTISKRLPPSPVPSPVEETPNLTLEQITKDVIPYCQIKFFEDMKKNLHSTFVRRLVYDYGYPKIDEEQKNYQKRTEQERIEKAKLDNLERQKLNEVKYFNKSIVNAKPKKEEHKVRANIIRGRLPADDMGEDDLRRKNRAAAVPEPFKQRQPSIEDNDLQRQSRTRQRSLSAGSRSDSQASRDSSSSSISSISSRNSSVSSSSTSSSGSSSSVSCSSRSSRSSSSSGPDEYKMVTSSQSREFKMETEDQSAPIPSTNTSVEFDVANALIAFQSQPVQCVEQENLEVISSKPIPKKRKNKAIDQANHDLKRAKTLDDSKEISPSKKKEASAEPKQVTFPKRTRAKIESMKNDIRTLDPDDVEYLEMVHQDFEKQHSTGDIGIPFGSEYINKVHLVSFKDMIKEIESKTHPRWWNGCSRCSIIQTSDRGKADDEEMTYEDLTRAPIKSHVIQANPTTRRDQRSDLRRIAALNPEIDPQFLKQFTANTLQMRAKNLRFSRSKIHQWGLFACEKIANGDAVIEYVGEKIRHSVADHRELVVYPSMANHDGSSYFFRIDTDVIDASFMGNKARFINHSCNPNCIAKIIKHDNGNDSIVIYAKQSIEEDEEITYDYKFPREEDKIRCNCKAPRCQGWLN